mgnify:CR=1 FL=1
MSIQSLTGVWEFRQAGTQEWHAASVPGGVHTDLMALGHIPDPFVGDNERRVQWVAESDWEYRREFAVGLACALAATSPAHAVSRRIAACDVRAIATAVRLAARSRRWRIASRSASGPCDDGSSASIRRDARLQM